MSEFPAQSNDIDVERIMEQIRARIESRRVADSTPADPAEEFAAALRPSESFDFHGNSIYRSSRGGVGWVLYGIRRLLRPLLKFVFNIDPMVEALCTQARLNAQRAKFDDEVARGLAAREQQDVLNRRVVQNLLDEMRKLSAEMKTQRTLVESMAERLDAWERQARTGGNAAPPQVDRQAEEPQCDPGDTPSAGR